MRSKTVFYIEALLTLYVMVASILISYEVLKWSWDAVLVPLIFLGIGRAFLVAVVLFINLSKVLWRKKS